MPRREQRLNPMPRRRPKAQPLSAEWMVLGASVTCEKCGWTSLGITDEDAGEMLAGHHCTEGA